METIKIVVKRMPTEKLVPDELVELSVKSLDESFVSAIRSIVHDKGDNGYPCRIAFGDYYSNMDLMNFDECFPYIIRNGKYEWNVPYSDVSIHEFLETNGLQKEDPIIVHINCYGGGDGSFFTMLIPWITAAWPYISLGLESAVLAVEITKLLNNVVLTFKKKNNQLPWPRDVSEAILSKRTWRKQELGKMLGTENDSLLEFILMSSGFKEKNGVYRSSKDRYRRYWKLSDESPYVYWGDYSNNSDDTLDWIGFLCYELNELLTDLMFNSYIMESDCFDVTIHQVNILMEESTYLKKGPYFRFVDFKGCDTLNTEDQLFLKEELERVAGFARMQLEYLDEKSKKEVVESRLRQFE